MEAGECAAGVREVVASVRILADRLKATAVQEAQQPVDHWSLAKEGLGLLFALGAAVQHEKGTHNLTGTRDTRNPSFLISFISFLACRLRGQQ
jgi:hypothetical protein